jgi:hypothetical protein
MSRFSPPGPIRTVLGTALLLLFALPTQAQDEIVPPTVTTTYALEGARVVQAPGEVVDPATVVVEDGVIAAVGSDVEVPYDARRIAADSLVVYAGFIDGLSHAGVEMPESSDEEGENDEVDPGDPPPDVAGIQPDRSVRPLLSPEESTLENLREVGFTAAHVVPEGQMLPGSGAHVLLGGDTASEMVLEAQPSLFAQIEEASDYVYPATDMAVIAKFRQLYREADRRQDLEAEYEANPTGQPRPPADPIHSSFFPVLDGETPLAFYADDALSLHRISDLQEELGFPYMLAGLGESFRALDALRGTDAPLFLTLSLPEAPKTPTGPDTSVADTTENPSRYYDADLRTTSAADVPAEETNLRLRHAVERERYRETASTLHEAGLDFGFTTRSVDAGDVRANLRTMIEHGLPEETALAALTTRPAALLGLEDRLGTVETGKIANLVVTDDSYFAEDARVQHVFVDGRLYDYSADESSGEITGDVSAVVGTWEYTLETPRGDRTGTLTFEGDASSLEGTITAQGESEPVESISFDGTTLSFTISSPQGSISVSVTVEGDTFEGTASVGGQSFPITGERTSTPN